MPRLLQIDSCLGIGSTGRIAEGIASVARLHGWETFMAHGSRYVGNTNQIPIQVGSKMDEYSHYFKSLLFDNHGLNSKNATKKLINNIVEIDPDIIHLHCIHGYYLNYDILFRFLAKYNRPIVWTQHDCWGFTGHCSYFEKIKCKKWESGCHDCELKSAYPKSIFLDNSKRNWNLKLERISALKDLTIVSVSKWLNSLVENSFLSKNKHLVIYNGVDTDVFKINKGSLRNHYGLQDKIILLAAATSWSEAKGLNDYIKLSKVLDSKYKIVLLGLNKSQLKSIPQNIIGLPRTNSQIDLVNWYSEANIVLNLSYQETFGLTTVEGLACGTPGIVYNSTASPELISPQTGIIVEPGDIRGVVKGIETISNNPEIFTSDRCVARIKEHFDATTQFKKYILLYNSLINN